jgi:hypothetical protein
MIDRRQVASCSSRVTRFWFDEGQACTMRPVRFARDWLAQFPEADALLLRGAGASDCGCVTRLRTGSNEAYR